MPIPTQVRAYLAKLGAKGGKVRSAAKTESCRQNAKLPRKRKIKP